MRIGTLYLLLCTVTAAPAGLVQWFPFEEGATAPTTNLTHSVVSTNTGTLSGAALPVWATTELPPVPAPGTTAALYFNPGALTINKPAVITDCLGIDGTKARTVSAWIKPEAVQGANPTLVHWGPGTPNGARFTFKLNNNSAGAGGWQVRLEVQGGGINGTKNLADGQWHHVAVVVTNGSTVGNAKLYVDGLPEAISSAYSSTAINTQTNTLYPVVIGNSSGWDSSRGFTGSIDDVRIYDQALAAADILALVYGNGNPPSLSSPLADQALVLGDTAASVSFAVTPDGTQPMQFQWKFYGTNLPNQTNASLLISPAGPANVGPYSVTISNRFGWTNASANVVLQTAPIEPLQQAVVAGATASLKVSMPAGSTGYAYQWRKNGVDIGGATDAAYTLTSATLADSSTNYAVVVTLNGASATSAPPATLTVLPLPTGSYSNAVAADGPVAWWRLDDPPGSSTATEVSGLYPGSIFPDVRTGVEGALLGDADTGAQFTGYSSSSRPGQSRIDVNYAPELNPSVFSLECWALVTGGAGTDRSPVTAREVGGNWDRGFRFYAGYNNRWSFILGNGSTGHEFTGPPVVENHWTHLVATYDGSRAAFYVDGALVASGPTAYVPNSANRLSIGAGATESASGGFFFPGRIDEVALYTNVLSLAQVQAHYAAAFPASAAPRFVFPPLSRAALAGESFSLAAGVHSTPPVSYQWLRDGIALPAANNSTLTLPAVSSADAGSYALVATHGELSVTSSPAALQVLLGEAVSVNLQGYENVNTIRANGGVAGAVVAPHWNEIGYNATAGSVTNLVDNKGQTNAMSVSWVADTNRRWNGPFTGTKADAALLNGFLEASGTTNITLTLENIPVSYQNAGYSLYVYMGEPSATAGTVNSYDSYGAVSVGAVTKYYHALDLAFWDGDFQAAQTTDPLEPNPTSANCAVFPNLNSASVTVTVTPHPYLAGPASLSGLQLVARVINPVPLTLSQADGHLVLSWEGTWVLQQKPVLDGSPAGWTDVAGAGSPYPVPAPLAGQQYYRLRSP